MDAAVYENLATYIGLYGYGQSLIMVWNVPLSIPIVEFIVVYSSLRLTNHMKIPTWSKPIIVGLLGMLFDFTLDPVATKEIFSTTSGTIGRWTWFIGAMRLIFMANQYIILLVGSYYVVMVRLFCFWGDIGIKNRIIIDVLDTLIQFFAC